MVIGVTRILLSDRISQQVAGIWFLFDYTYVEINGNQNHRI